MTTIDETSKAWSAIAAKWTRYFKPPSRPSSSEVNVYQKWVNQELSPDASALLLGATPELLDVLSDSNIKTDLIDINETMVNAMFEIAKPAQGKRKVTIGNWLDMPFEDATFDVVLGDAVIPNVPYESRDQMVTEIKRVMKPGAVYLNRAFNMPESKEYGNVDEILFGFHDKPINETTAIELVVELQILNFDANNHRAAMADVRALVEPLRENGQFHRNNEKEIQLLNILWDYWLNEISDKTWIYDTKANEEQELYKPFFVIEETFEASDHPYGHLTPLYKLKKPK